MSKQCIRRLKEQKKQNKKQKQNRQNNWNSTARNTTTKRQEQTTTFNVVKNYNKWEKHRGEMRESSNSTCESQAQAQKHSGSKKSSSMDKQTHPKCQKKQQQKSDIIFTRNKINRARKSTGGKNDHTGTTNLVWILSPNNLCVPKTQGIRSLRCGHRPQTLRPCHRSVRRKKQKSTPGCA